MINKGDLNAITQTIKLVKAFNSLYAAEATASKISSAFMVLGLVGPHDRIARWVVYLVTSIAIVLGMVFFGFTFTCALDGITLDHGETCNTLIPANVLNIAWSFSLAVADVTYTVLCTRLIWQAVMSMRVRVTACILLSLTSIGAVASILRCATLLGWGYITLDGQHVRMVTWSVVEGGMAIIGMSLVACRPLLVRVMPATLTSTSRTGQSMRLPSYSRSVLKSQTIETSSEERLRSPKEDFVANTVVIEA